MPVPVGLYPSDTMSDDAKTSIMQARNRTVRRTISFLTGCLLALWLSHQTEIGKTVLYFTCPSSTPLWSKPGKQTMQTVISKSPLERKLFCVVTASSEVFYKSAHHADVTWVRKCDGARFVGVTTPNTTKQMNIKSSIVKSKSWELIEAILRGLYQDLESYEFYLIAKDTNYVLIENLHRQLQILVPEEPLIVGLQTSIYEQIFSIDAAVVLSKSAVSKLAELAWDQHPECPNPSDKSPERALASCGTVIEMAGYNAMDGGSIPLFSKQSLELMFQSLIEREDMKSTDELQREWNKIRPQEVHISFADVSPAMMYIKHFLAYHLKPVNPVVHESLEELLSMI